ncbi:sensor histidine kinase [Miltoncostaea marina]|uniref:sensor histidine kinase n=1 Tax=Miltoncostaea marina TaxID=2843215 RepID=UPI001C3C25B6|nr:ATP-binding protein [Miltoncostaea marina]
MSRGRALGLQGWLVGALLAVGMAASLSVLLVVLPTLESSARSDRAKRDAQALQAAVARTAADAEGGLPAEARLRALAARLRGETGAEVRVRYAGPVGAGGVAIDVRAPVRTPLLDEGPALVPGRATVLREDTVVAAAAEIDGGLGGGGTVSAARAVTGLAPELAIVRRRVIIAMAVVLGLAALAGVALANVLGGRIRRLAGTSAALAAGDLTARAPRARLAPEELVTLGEGLNGMAARLQSLVDQLRGERDRDRALIGSLAEGVLTVGGDGAVTVANEAATRLLRLPEQEGAARLEDLPAPVVDAVLAARAGAPPPAEGRVVALPDGAELEVHVVALADDPAGGTVITLRDVTEQRRLERARRDLVANVSHELKTPIAALKGFLELLEDGVDERHRREFVAAMTRETSRLERLVEEQLQLARLDAGAVPLELQRVDLSDVAEVVAGPRIALAAREGVTLAVTRAPAGEAVAEVDPARVEQILLILLDNAQRHTPSGGRVDVVVGREGGEATLTVRDTGEGIADDDQPFVFDRFYRADGSREGRSAGLGLAIARGLAQAHGGSIALESRLGEGSAFTVRLPLRARARRVAFAP